MILVHLCKACRHWADKIAQSKPFPQRFQLEIGHASKVLGHGRVHKWLEEKYHALFGDIDEKGLEGLFSEA